MSLRCFSFASLTGRWFGSPNCLGIRTTLAVSLLATLFGSSDLTPPRISGLAFGGEQTAPVVDRPAESTAAAPEPEYEIIVDVTRSPDLAEWADEARVLCVEWYPRLHKQFATTGFTPYPKVELVFDPDYKGVAATGGSRIVISADWVRQHPADRGMVIHELMHVVQAYPAYDPPWLVEAIADHVRYFEFEPDPKRVFPCLEQSRYQDGYGLAAAFLDWAQTEHDPQLIAKLHAQLRDRRYDASLFHQSTGKTLAELWDTYRAARLKSP